MVMRESTTTDTSAYPMVRLSAGQQVWISGDEHFVKAKQGQQWVLVDPVHDEFKFFTNADLVKMYGRGELQYWSRSSRERPLSPLAEGVCRETEKESAKRKHAYVCGVVEHPEGFRSSKPWLQKAIQRIAQTIGDQDMPSAGSVLNWKVRHDAHFAELGLAAYAPRHDLKGKRGTNLLPPQTEAIDAAINRYLQGGTIEAAHHQAKQYIADFNDSPAGRRFCATQHQRHLDDGDRLQCPSLATLRRAVNQVSPFVREAGRNGEYYAKKRNRTFQTRALPGRPYEEVEVDFTPADVVLVADNNTHLGRPHLIVFRDRATAMILGASISFDEPGYAAVMEGLKNTTYRKSIKRIDGVQDEDWPCMGRIERLYIDNGREFANGQLCAAATELGFEIHRLPPREPWLKGGVERFFRDFGEFTHQFAGTTLSNAVQRRDYEDLDPPIFTLGEFKDLMIKWIVTVYNRNPNRMLGDVPGVARAPIDAWKDKISKLDLPPLPSEELFISLAGEVLREPSRNMVSNGIISSTGHQNWIVCWRTRNTAPVHAVRCRQSTSCIVIPMISRGSI